MLSINRKVPFFLLQSSFPLIVKLFLSAYKLQMQVLIIEMKSLFLKMKLAFIKTEIAFIVFNRWKITYLLEKSKFSSNRVELIY